MKPITIEQAEKMAGSRLDRRRKYYDLNGEVAVATSWTQDCSGCLELGDYGGGLENYEYDDKAGCYLGFGCDECGYTGKRVQHYGLTLREHGAMTHPTPNRRDNCA